LGKAEELGTWEPQRFSKRKAWELEKRVDVDGDEQEERFAGLDVHKEAYAWQYMCLDSD
jgi:hypothetical protein